jgi:hypothetical protein
VIHWSLGAEEMRALEAQLTSFVGESQARLAVLLDRAGRHLTSVGDGAGIDPTTFASLAAADFAASDQLAKLLGESEFASLYHAGEDHSMYLVDVGGHAILAVIFDARTTLGLVRLRTRSAAPKIAGAGVDEAWLAAASSEIDRLFDD